jgi:phenylalanyl-tRNA synthetase beta chain
MDNITKNKSPLDMRIRLYYCGMRGINLLADVTNYIMLEIGQPTHAFDASTMQNIVVTTPKEKMNFKTLDGVERVIDEDTLMIWNGETPTGIAGIMGGLESEIVENTSAVVLESANFDGVSIRKSSSRLGHRTDASARYEKMLDPELTLAAVGRFVELVKSIDPEAKVASKLTDAYVRKYPEITLSFDKKYVDRYTGIDISCDEILTTLTSLGFKVTLDNGNFSVVVPSWRATKDVTIKADIIEEITRIYGYDNFNVNTTVAPLYPVRAFVEKTTDEQIKDILVKSFGLHEVHSYIWAYTDECKKLGIEYESNIKLLNATNPNIETIRKSMVPNQLCQVKSNTGFSTDFGVFEIGRTVDGLKDDGLCNERKKLCVTLYSKTKSLETLYVELATMLSVITDNVKHKALIFTPVEATLSYEHPRNLNEISCDGVVLGKIGIVHPTVAKKIDKKAAIVFAEIDVADFSHLADAGIHYEEPSRFPAIDVDLSFVSDVFAPIGKAISDANCPLIKNVQVVDTYRDENGKSITTRITFSHPEKTLTRDEVMDVANGIIDELAKQNIPLKA